MATYFWGVPPGKSGPFDDEDSWFNAKSGLFADGRPGLLDTANVVGAVAALPDPPVHLVIAAGQTETISRLQVMFQSKDQDFVWIEGSLTVLDEVFFENDRGNLRFIGTLTLDGTPTEVKDQDGKLIETIDNGATMDVDFLHIGGDQVVSHKNVVTVDDDGMLKVVGNATVTTRRLEVLGTGGFAVSDGGTVSVTGPETAFIQQGAGATLVSVDGLVELNPDGSVKKTLTSSLLIDGDLVLDGVLLIAENARVQAHTVTVRSENSAGVIVGDFFDDLSDKGIFSRFDSHDLTLGNGSDEIGSLVAFTNGRVFISHTLTMLDTATDGSTFSAEVITLGGFIEIGGEQATSPGHDTILIHDAGLTAGLIGHGFVETGTLRNDGLVVAQGGLLLVHAEVTGQEDHVGVTGQGSFRVETNSTLEIDGNVSATVTVALSGTFSTLILDDPGGFDGKIASIDFTDTIRLNKTGSAFGNGVQSAGIAGDGNGGHVLAIFQNGDPEPLVYEIEGTQSLYNTRVLVSETADHTTTFLNFTSIGTTTTSYLDADGKEAIRFASGDGDKNNVSHVYIGSDGTPMFDKSGEAANHLYIDYTKGHLNGLVLKWRTADDKQAFIEATWDNSDPSEVQAVHPSVAVQDPSSPDLTQPHNLWYSFRHGPLSSVNMFDGVGTFGTEGVLGHAVFMEFVNGLLTGATTDLSIREIVDFLNSVGSPPFGSVSAGAPETEGPALIQATQDFKLVEETFDPSGILVAFTTVIYSQGELSVISEWERLGDGRYQRTDYQVDPPVIIQFSPFSRINMESYVLPVIAQHEEYDRPVIRQGSATFDINLSPTLVGSFGSALDSGVVGAPVSGSVRFDANGGIITQDRPEQLLDPSGEVPSNDGAGYTAANAVETLRNRAEEVADTIKNGNIVAGGGGNIVAGGGGNIVAGGGGNLVTDLGGQMPAFGGMAVEAGTKAISAGFGNVLGLVGKGTPGRYVANALVFADASGDGLLNNGEAWDITDSSGHFELFGGWGTLVLTGGTDTGTNLPFKATLTAPLGSTDISALSTLASGLAKDDGDIDGAIRQLQFALGLDTSRDFTVLDPIASTENGDAASAKIHVEMSKTMDAVFLIGAAFAAMGADQSTAQAAAFTAMVDVVNKSGTLNLSDKGTVGGLISAVGATLFIDGSKIADALAGTIVSTGQLIDKLLVDEGAGKGLTSSITMIETAVQGALVSSLKAAGGDPGKLGPSSLLLQATSDDGKDVVTPGHVVTITVTTSETVTVAGAPTLQLGNGKLANFASGSGSGVLVFKYAVQAGDGNGASELQVNGLNLAAGATIKDVSGNNLAGTVAGSLGIEIDAGAVVSIAATDAAKAEGQAGTTPFTFTVTRTGDTTVSHSASWTVTGSGTGATQADGLDFAGGVLSSGTVSFAAAETSRTITLDVVSDSGVEPDEGFKVSLTNPSSGLVIGAASAVGTIVNDDATVSIGVLSAVKAEGNGGTTSFTFNLAFRGDISVPHTVSYAVVGAGINPASASDFAGGVLPSGTVTFAVGESDKTIAIEVIGDAVIEADEGFAVELSNPSAGLVIGAASASGTVVNDDASVSIVAQSAVMAEGNGGTTPFTFTVTRTGDLAAAHSVAWSIVGSGVDGADPSDIGGTALNGGTLTFGVGESTKSIVVEVAGDSEIEFDEEFTVTLASPSTGLVLGTSSAVGTILNDDGNVVSIAGLSASKAEGDSGTTPFTFAVTLNEAGVTMQTVDWAVTGTNPQPADAADFGATLPSGTVTFAAGETSKTITLPVSGDSIVEPDNFFTVTLSNASAGLSLGPASAVGIIQNDDRATLSIAALSAGKPEGNGGTTDYTFTVNLDQASFEGQTATWAVTGSGANAANAADFGGALPSGTVSFAAGETSKVVTISVAGDTSVEFDESFAVTLSNISAGLLVGTASASGTVQNDDRSTVSIAAQSAVKMEGNNGTTSSTFVISLSQAGVATQTVGWAVAGSGANPASAADFAGGVLPGGVVTFAPGETSKTVTVNVAGDTTVEPDEGYSVTLSSPSAGLVVGVASAAGTIQNDDIAVAVATHNDAYVVLQGQSLTAAASLLSNDVAATTATLLSGPTHGSLQLAGNGTFTYAPASGFFGVDSFTYRASNGGSTDDGQVHVHVVPVNTGAATTLGLLTLTAEEQIASTYTAFFGRAADMGGFGFWVGEFVRLLPTQGAAALFANIASSFGISNEAKALYPFLANPFGATDGQISAFLDSVYNNLFNRSSDAGGLGYWTDQIKQTLQAGQFVGSILVNIMGGAQDTAAGKDITTLMGKVAVSLAFVREQEEHHTAWAGASDIGAATTLLQAVTADPQTVLVGVRNAENLIAAHA